MTNSASNPIILSVSELTFAIKSQLEPCFKHVFVRGEVANLRKQHSGHIYFSLLEGESLLNAVLFRGNAASLAFPLKEGDSVIAAGEISVYPQRGSYQLIVRELSPLGLGAALLKLQALKKKLQELGWFRQERKRPLPKEIKTIGLVTSPSGAVLHDIINVLTRRLGTFHIVVNPVRVQGEEAPLEIARAINEFSKFSLVDVVIVCRGGGSSEDLSAFNDERVALACFQSKIPIVSAIGHETDLSITDLVADLRAPTPSAAAELVSKARAELIERLQQLKSGIFRALKNIFRLAKASVDSFFKQLHQAPLHKKLEHWALRLDDIEEAIFAKIRQEINHKKMLVSQLAKACRKQDPRAKLQDQKTQLVRVEASLKEKIHAKLASRKEFLLRSCNLLDERMKRKQALVAQPMKRDWLHNLRTILNRQLTYKQQKLTALKKNIDGLHPKNTLARGYAIVFRQDKVVRSVKELTPQDHIRVEVSDGQCHAIVEELL
jgi:exodeoxyribonuclease VII large subunit